MITSNPYNGRTVEHLKIDDIHEDKIKVTESNATPLEIRLLRINKGRQRRQRNNHAQRLAKFKK